MNWPVLLDWAVPSVIGFVFGYLTCLLVGKAIKDEDSATPKRQRRAQLARTIFGVLLVVLSIATFVDVQQSNACFRGALEGRDGIGTKQIQDQISFLTTIGEGVAAQESLDKYIGTLREQLRVRDANPLECR